MPTRRKTIKRLLNFGNEEPDIDEIMGRIRQEMESMGYQPYPSTLNEVEKICVRASRVGYIDSSYNFGLCASTLLLGGAEKAREEGKHHIQVAHILRSWEEDIAVGNCPPYKCVRRSILDNRPQIFERFRNLETIKEQYLDELGE